MHKTREHWMWRGTTRKKFAWFILSTFALSTLGPDTLALAAPGLFVRPGAGISRLPLEVTALNAPGFGQLEEALNIASGNLFVGTQGISLNTQRNPGDETTNTIGGTGWNFTPRMRLDGFGTGGISTVAGQPSLVQNPDVHHWHWDGYGGWSQRPTVTPMYRMLTQDGAAASCNNYANASGIVRWGTDQAGVAPGRYRMIFDARVMGGTLPINYGFGVGTPQSATLTTTWQTFTFEQTFAAHRPKMMEVFEATATNSAWEVGNFRVQLWDNATSNWGANLIDDRWAQNAFWSSYCGGVNRELFYRLSAHNGPNNNGTVPTSGIMTLTADGNPKPAGRYQVSFSARTRTGTLPVEYGLDDLYKTTATLSTQWQTFTFDFTVDASTSTRYDSRRVLQVWENTSAAVDWEVQNLQTRRYTAAGNWDSLSGRTTLALASGEGSVASFARVAPVDINFTTAPSWIRRYQGPSGAGNAVFYRLTVQPGLSFNQEWIVLVRSGVNVFAHHFSKDGNRTTFNTDGDYADYSQTLHQQLRGAQAGDPEGRAATTPKTEFDYHNTNSGLIREVRDEWGRISRYDWDIPTQRLLSVRSMLTNSADNDSWTRLIEFNYDQYGVSGGPYYLTNIAFSTRNLSNQVRGRWYEFDYNHSHSGTRYLSTIRRGTAGTGENNDRDGIGWRSTTYEYTGTRVNRVRFSPATEPDITYNYSTVPATSRFNITTINNPSGNPYQDLDGTNLRGSELAPSGGTTIAWNYGIPLQQGIYPLWGQNEHASYTAPGGMYNLKVVARGESGTPILDWPRLSFRVNDVEQSQVRINSTGYGVYNLGLVSLTEGQNLKLVFTNDFCNNGQPPCTQAADRNVFIDALILQPLEQSVTNSVTMAQGEKRSEFYFDGLGQLRRKEIRDLNPNDSSERLLQWRYRYYNSGNLGLIVEPSGKTVHRVYDRQTGDLTREAVYQNEDLWSGVQEKPPVIRIESFESVERRPGHTNWITALSGQFKLTARVARDNRNPIRGVTWYQIINGNRVNISNITDQTRVRFDQTAGTITTPVPNRPGEYTVTATFITSSARG